MAALVPQPSPANEVLRALHASQFVFTLRPEEVIKPEDSLLNALRSCCMRDAAPLSHELSALSVEQLDRFSTWIDDAAKAIYQPLIWHTAAADLLRMQQSALTELGMRMSGHYQCAGSPAAALPPYIVGFLARRDFRFSHSGLCPESLQKVLNEFVDVEVERAALKNSESLLLDAAERIEAFPEMRQRGERVLANCFSHGAFLEYRREAGGGRRDQNPFFILMRAQWDAVENHARAIVNQELRRYFAARDVLDAGAGVEDLRAFTRLKPTLAPCPAACNDHRSGRYEIDRLCRIRGLMGDLVLAGKPAAKVEAAVAKEAEALKRGGRSLHDSSNPYWPSLEDYGLLAAKTKLYFQAGAAFLRPL